MLLSVWKEDFGTPVPVHLIFTKKNIGYLAEVKQREVKLIPICGTAGYSLWSDISMQEFCLPTLMACVNEASRIWSAVSWHCFCRSREKEDCMLLVSV